MPGLQLQNCFYEAINSTNWMFFSYKPPTAAWGIFFWVIMKKNLSLLQYNTYICTIWINWKVVCVCAHNYTDACLCVCIPACTCFCSGATQWTDLDHPARTPFDPKPQRHTPSGTLLLPGNTNTVLTASRFDRIAAIKQSDLTNLHYKNSPTALFPVINRSCY